VTGARLPSNHFNIIFKVDVYNYGTTMAYHGEGPALILVVQRYQLREFLEELEAEYDAFCKTWGIQQPQEPE